MTDSGITEQLVGFALRQKVPSGGGPMRQAVLRTFTDTLGVIVAGTASGIAPIVTARYGDAPPASAPMRPDDRALVLATAGHTLDYDDTVPTMPGHPSVPVVSALAASLPGTGASGRDLLDAYAIGVEVATKLGRAVGMGHYHRGWHATSTHSTFGALLAVARLQRLPEDVARRAVGIAVSLAAGAQCNFGTMTKPLHAGFCARNAVEAIALARAGVTANESALEARNGYFQLFAQDDSGIENFIPSLGTPWIFTDPGVVLKRWPCCYATHRVIAAAKELMSQAPFTADDVEAAACTLPIGGLRPLPYAAPVTGLEGKFSLQYALAAQLYDQAVTLNSFTTESVLRAGIRDLLTRISVRESEECSPGDPHGMTMSNGTRGFIKLRLTLRDGRSLQTQRQEAPGGPADPFAPEDVANKFTDCLTFAGHPRQVAEQLLARTLGLDTDDDPAALIDECITPH